MSNPTTDDIDVPVVVGGTGTPLTGPPNSWGDYGNTWRWFGDDGRAEYDIDVNGPSGGHSYPEEHFWKWDKDGKAHREAKGHKPTRPLPPVVPDPNSEGEGSKAPETEAKSQPVPQQKTFWDYAGAVVKCAGAAALTVFLFANDITIVGIANDSAAIAAAAEATYNWQFLLN